MPDLKIVTDLEIPQCPVWGDETELLYRSEEPRGLWKGLWRLFMVGRNYDVVILSDIRLAQLFGLLKFTLRWKQPKQMVLELMLDEATDNLGWNAKIFFQRLCFASIERIIVSSSNEIAVYSERLKLPESKFKFLPFHTCVKEPRYVQGAGYILSAGKTDRDYSTLAKAVEGLDVKVVVVSDEYNIKGIEFPPNVEVHCNIPYEKYIELLLGCSLVVVPLKKRVKSTGQVVFLEAMALGKPVIATLATGTIDYIEQNVTGVLIPPENIDALKHAIEEFINNRNSYEKIAVNALDKVKCKYTFEHFTQNILNEAVQMTQTISK